MIKTTFRVQFSRERAEALDRMAKARGAKSEKVIEDALRDNLGICGLGPLFADENDDLGIRVEVA